MSPHSEGKFNVAVGAVLENTKTGKILLLKRSSTADFSPGIWEEITGRMKQFEEPEDALKREILEESGISEIQVIKPLTINHFYRGEKTAEKEIILIIYWCQTTQENVTISQEHEDCIWLSPQEALHKTSHPGIQNDIKTFLKEK